MTFLIVYTWIFSTVSKDQFSIIDLDYVKFKKLFNLKVEMMIWELNPHVTQPLNFRLIWIIGKTILILRLLMKLLQLLSVEYKINKIT